MQASAMANHALQGRAGSLAAWPHAGSSSALTASNLDTRSDSSQSLPGAEDVRDEVRVRC
jgi:hypothetical protein